MTGFGVKRVLGASDLHSRRLGEVLAPPLEAPVLRLVACASCHTQYDVTHVVEKEISCRCGETIENRDLQGVDAQVHRCSSCGAQVAADAAGCDFCGSDLKRQQGSLSLICPECYGRNSEDSRFCTACGVGFDPEPVNVEGVELPCPVCTCLMSVRAVGGVGVNECASCNGLWVPEDKLDLLVDRAVDAARNAQTSLEGRSAPRVTGANPATQGVQYRKCPECDGFMSRRNFRKTSGVIIDVCTSHGSWLDADELERIAGFITSGGRPEASRMLSEMNASAARATAASLAQPTPMHHGSTMRVFETPDRREGDIVSTLLNVFIRIFD